MKLNPVCLSKSWMICSLLSLAAAASLPGANSYLVHNLVSDLPNTADYVDKNLTNPWGIASSATGPFWFGNNHSGTSTLADTSGAPVALIVSVPSPGMAPGALTGVVFNGTSSFLVADAKPASFLFCTEDGTLAGWNGSVNATQAKILVNNSAAKAVYKGCALGGTAAAPLLYAANFQAGTIDVFGGDFKPIQDPTAFKNAAVPAGFAPFNVQNLGGTLYVTYAKQGSSKMDDVAGPGNGYVASFDMSGKLFMTVVSQGPLNSPWGLAIAPAGFGDFGGSLLVGNFGDGTIHAFNASTGALMGVLNDTTGKAITITGLWALQVGNGGRGGDAASLYFTAGSPGPNGEAVETHGLFGSIQSAPSFQVTGVKNGASFSQTLAANTFGTILGGGLSATTRTWADKDFVNGQLPTQLDGAGVTVNDKPAYISYVSPTQINFLIPSDAAPAAAQIKTTNNGLSSAAASITLQSAAPSFFVFGTTKYIAATHADGSFIGPANLIAGGSFTPAKPGETVVLYANGFGQTTPPVPNGQIVKTALPLTQKPTVTMAGMLAQVEFAGLSATGLYQLNVIVPNIPEGAKTPVDVTVAATASGMQSQDGVLLSVTPAVAIQPTTLDIINFAFVPTPVTVAAGTELTWTNKDAATHTVTADDNRFLSGNMPNGQSFSQKLLTPGTYTYHCSIHPNMKGTIVVK
jgi:uncharacterized protein (TIGR03118 family)